MKKTFFAAAAVALAVLFAACNGFTAPDAAEPAIVGYTEDGRAIMELTLTTGGEGARSLISDEAKNYSTYYEVVFRVYANGSSPAATYALDSYRRLSWRGSDTARIRLPAVNYDGSEGDAVLFVGDNNKTLLALGKIRDVSNTIGGVTTIDLGSSLVTKNTTAITFSLAPLKAEIDIGEDLCDTSLLSATAAYTASPFKITGGQLPAPLQTFFPAGVTYQTVPIPVFEVGTMGTAVTATPVTASYTITVDGSSSLNDAWTAFTGLIRVKDTGRVRSSPVRMDDGLNPVALAASSITGPAAGANFTGQINFSFTPQADKSGLCQISFEIPVMAIDAAATKSPETWYIRGGIYNGDLDDGSLNPSEGGIGGSIVLGIGDYDQARNSGIVIEAEWD